jgi:hypothetical protein
VYRVDTRVFKKPTSAMLPRAALSLKGTKTLRDIGEPGFATCRSSSGALARAESMGNGRGFFSLEWHGSYRCPLGVFHQKRVLFKKYIQNHQSAARSSAFLLWVSSPTERRGVPKRPSVTIHINSMSPKELVLEPTLL